MRPRNKSLIRRIVLNICVNYTYEVQSMWVFFHMLIWNPLTYVNNRDNDVLQPADGTVSFIVTILTTLSNVIFKRKFSGEGYNCSSLRVIFVREKPYSEYLLHAYHNCSLVSIASSLTICFISPSEPVTRGKGQKRSSLKSSLSS